MNIPFSDSCDQAQEFAYRPEKGMKEMLPSASRWEHYVPLLLWEVPIPAGRSLCRLRQLQMNFLDNLGLRVDYQGPGDIITHTSFHALLIIAAET